jgi:hypothetical protein
MSIVAKTVRRKEMKKRLRFIIVVNRSSITNNKDNDKENTEKTRPYACIFQSAYTYILYEILSCPLVSNMKWK